MTLAVCCTAGAPNSRCCFLIAAIVGLCHRAPRMQGLEVKRCRIWPEHALSCSGNLRGLFTQGERTMMILPHIRKASSTCLKSLHPMGEGNIDNSSFLE